MSSDTLKLYITPEHDCSYLPGRQTKALFIDPNTTITGSLYAKLNGMGFRRSGKYVYKPNCAACSACMSSRVVIAGFSPSRSQTRIIKRNTDLRVKPMTCAAVQEAYPLYERYINTRHSDGDMYPANKQQFESFLLEPLDSTQFIGFYDAANVIGVAVIDHVGDGLSALYTFFEPTQPKRGLGVYGILWQINECRRLGLPHLYLGYWIKGCDKMSYKQRYQPLEVYIDKQWSPFGDASSD